MLAQAMQPVWKMLDQLSSELDQLWEERNKLEGVSDNAPELSDEEVGALGIQPLTGPLSEQAKLWNERIKLWNRQWEISNELAWLLEGLLTPTEQEEAQEQIHLWDQEMKLLQEQKVALRNARI